MPDEYYHTTDDLLHDLVATTPDKTAVIYHGQELTFQEASRRAQRLATGLACLGITKGMWKEEIVVLIPVTMSYAMLKAEASPQGPGRLARTSTPSARRSMPIVPLGSFQAPAVQTADTS